MALQNFKELNVWRKSIELVKCIYTMTATMPAAERYGLISQMQRAAISIPSNIAEGSKRGTQKDYLQFLRIADGSSSELETQLIIIQELFPQVHTQGCMESLHEIQRMLGALMNAIVRTL